MSIPLHWRRAYLSDETVDEPARKQAMTAPKRAFAPGSASIDQSLSGNILLTNGTQGSLLVGRWRIRCRQDKEGSIDVGSGVSAGTREARTCV